MRLVSVLAGVVLAAVAGAGAAPARAGDDPAAPPPARAFGKLEQESIDEGLAHLGLRVDPRPEGKMVGDIHVVNQEVFSQRDWWFQWFNHFHRTTREETLRREVLLRPGMPYDQALVEETLRNLQSPPTLTVGASTFYQPELSSVIAMVPVTTPRPEVVDLLLVTRDVWSLRFNTNFEFQQNTLALLDTSLSENNLFGWRKYLSFGFLLDQGTMGFGPTYFDPNVMGTRLTLLASASLWYARASDTYEGNSEIASLRYPLFSLASRWGGGVDVTHNDTVVRSFQGNSLRLEDLSATPDVVEQIPYEYRQLRTTVDSSVVRSFGAAAVIQRVSLGHLFQSQRYAVLPDFAGGAVQAEEFLEEFAPVSEQRSEPYLRYEMFTPRYAVLRDLDTFDLRENKQLGPHVTARVSYGLPALGADFSALGLGASASWAASPAAGYVLLSVSGSTRLRDGRFIDQNSTEQLYAATPLFGRALRVVVMGQASATRADTQKTLYFLGGQTGLRGYAIGDFQGTSLLLGHVELRTEALPIFSQRIGGLLFYDVGDAAASFAQIVAYHDLGFGLRWLIPQLNSSVVRVDWAFATQSTAFTRAGAPGRVTAGFQQVF
jgi:hypothetical protein